MENFESSACLKSYLYGNASAYSDFLDVEFPAAKKILVKAAAACAGFILCFLPVYLNRGFTAAVFRVVDTAGYITT